MLAEPAENLRYQLVFAALAGARVAVEAAQPFDRFELLFVELLLRVTRGSRAVFSRGQRRVDFAPGSVEGAAGPLRFDCGQQRAVGYFLEPLLLLLLFARAPSELELAGLTNDSVDVDVDRLKDGLLPLLERCAQGRFALELRVLRRGFRPDGAGLVALTARPLARALPPLALVPALAKRVRGVALVSRVSPQFLGRMITAAREVLNDFLPDVWVHSEAVRGGPGRYFGLSLATEAGVTAGACFDALSAGAPPAAEAVGAAAALALLDELVFGGAALDSSFQSVLFAFMALADGPSSAVVARVTDHAAATLRLLHRAFRVQFTFTDVEPRALGAAPPFALVRAACRGAGVLNRFREAG